MNLFERIKNTILADLHDAIDKKEMKNPVALLNQYLRDCEKEAKKVNQLIDRHYQLKEEFFREWKHAEYMARKRQEQSQIAQKAQELELYEMAVQEQQQFEQRAARLKVSYEETVNQLGDLEQKYREMKLKIKDMQMKRMELMGRENVARINQKINKAIYNAETDRAFTRFEEVEHHIANLEARVNHGYERNMFDHRISQLEDTLKNRGNSIEMTKN
ncbi:PspA/IM30 family protein [Bacillus aquiflavi]|uniref:PspA/IM30 family protein n=1 Tax=Bacillus aquiflavi TaxID=2672567 RepID=A0A6B3VNT7_9BACI|nr:PspA/IM30 family protein [Bacillus aquiflavi]MBA4535574.1 PspA/IM30 family protein [Bacillus aquiflavi]NEY79950.1 PspA/IM30 family protein [Bacillus aquiflavi]UAC48893.1 PspA/IM30 family protein [Bacillus aquiflavi]